MDDETAWTEVETARLRLADLLAELPDDDWERASLCGGWRVRDVAAHVTLPPQLPPLRWVVEFARAGGSFDRMIRDSAIRHARNPNRRIIAELRQYAGSRRVPPAPGTGVATNLMDVLTHTLDITVPLGRPAHIPSDAAAVGLRGAWGLRVPFNPRKKLRGIRCVATDTDWSVGDGPEVTGPAEAFLLLLTNRPAGFERLSGPGLARLLHTVGDESAAPGADH